MAYVTAPDRRSAGNIAEAVLRKRLAACANLASIQSIYWWEGSLQRGRETLIVFKTRRALVPQLMETVRALHPYETPCIVTYSMDAGFPPYVAWIDRETRLQR